MTIDNGDFEIAGATPAEARGWSRSISSFGRYAAFRVPFAASTAFERFEWHALKRGFAGFYQDLTRAFFDYASGTPQAFEDFEDLWGAQPASVRTGALAPFVLTDGATLILRVQGGALTTITFQASDFTRIEAAGAEEVARVIARQLPAGASARLDPHSARRVLIETGRTGVKANFEITGGSALAALGLAAGVYQGTAEAGTFYRVSEFDFLDFEGALDAEDFSLHPGPLDAALDRRKRFTLALSEIFTDTLFVRVKSAYTMVPVETFVGYSELLTINFEENA